MLLQPLRVWQSKLSADICKCPLMSKVTRVWLSLGKKKETMNNTNLGNILSCLWLPYETGNSFLHTVFIWFKYQKEGYSSQRGPDEMKKTLSAVRYAWLRLKNLSLLPTLWIPIILENTGEANIGLYVNSFQVFTTIHIITSRCSMRWIWMNVLLFGLSISRSSLFSFC